MLSRYYIAKNLQSSLQKKMQIIMDNISNSMTVGFKQRKVDIVAQEPTFFAQILDDCEKVEGEDHLRAQKAKLPEYGTSVTVAQVIRPFDYGPIEITNQPLDLAVENGNGYFQFRMPNGTVAYSRAGNLQMNNEGYIVDPNGHPVEPAIRIPPDARDLTFDKEGRVFAKSGNDSRPMQLGQVVFATFARPEELNEVGQNLLVQTPLSGEAVSCPPGQAGAGYLKQGALEMANVNIMEAMMEMLNVQRQYQMSIGSQSTIEAMIKAGADLKG